MAEWLRRQTRNLVGIALVGSNPAVVEFIFLLNLFFYKIKHAILAHDQKVTVISLSGARRGATIVLRRGQFRSY